MSPSYTAALSGLRPNHAQLGECVAPSNGPFSKCYRTRLVAASPCVRVRRAFQLAILRMVDHSEAGNPTAGRAGQSRTCRSGRWLYKTRRIETGRNKHPRRRRSEQDRKLRRPNRRARISSALGTRLVAASPCGKIPGTDHLESHLSCRTPADGFCGAAAPEALEYAHARASRHSPALTGLFSM
jgi:hypothetical protein